MLISFSTLLLVLCIHTVNAPALTIKEGLKIVTTSGRDVGISMAEEEAAASDIPAASSPLYPSADIYANQTWLRYQPEVRYTKGSPVALSEHTYLTYGLRVKQLIYDFGKTRSGIEMARIGLKVRELDTERVRNISALNFIVAYLDLLEAIRFLYVAEKEVEQFQAHLVDTKAMFEEGLITKNDLLQAEVMLSDARQRLFTVENLRRIRASRINSLLMRPLGDEVRAQELQEWPLAGIGLDEAWRAAEAGRAELRKVKMQIDEKTAEMEAIKAEYYPGIYIMGGYEYKENRYMVHDENWSLIAGININISSGGRTRAMLKKTGSEINALRLKWDRMLDGIKLEVMASYLELQSAQDKVLVTEKSVEQAEENLRLQRLRYREGVGTATEVLDAVSLLTKAETNYWTAVYDVREAEARLIYSMGKDLTAVYGD